MPASTATLSSTAIDIGGGLFQWEQEEDHMRCTNSRRQQSQHFVRTTRGNVSRRKLNAVKAFKSVKAAKERRNATKTREKKERRNTGRGIDLFHMVCGLDNHHEEAAVILKPHPNLQLAVVSATIPELVVTFIASAPVIQVETKSICSDNQTLGGLYIPSLHSFGNSALPPPPGLEHVHASSSVQETPLLHLNSVVPLLSFTATPNAKTIQFLQQELDILNLLTFSGVALNDIPLMYTEQYGIDICLPDSLTPEDMLLLSQRVIIYERNGDITCALTSQHEYLCEGKESVIFFVKQEFRLLSLLASVPGGLTQHDLRGRFEEKYKENIILPLDSGETLHNMLLRTGRVAYSECDLANSSCSDRKYELIPYLFL